MLLVRTRICSDVWGQMAASGEILHVLSHDPSILLCPAWSTDLLREERAFQEEQIEVQRSWGGSMLCGFERRKRTCVRRLCVAGWAWGYL